LKAHFLRNPPKNTLVTTFLIDSSLQKRYIGSMDEKALFGRLENISGTLEAILVEMKKPRHILLRILDISAAGITVLGLIAIIEQVMKWITGG